MRGKDQEGNAAETKDQEGNAAETIEHASSQEILKEAPSLAHVDGMTH